MDHPPTRTQIAGALLDLAGQSADLAEAITFSGPETVLPSSFRVTDAAASLVGAAGAAIANLRDAQPAVHVNTIDACVAFQSERHLEVDWDRQLLDELAGHYTAADGHVQFHTNFPHHRAALLRAFELPESTPRSGVERVVSELPRLEIEQRVSGEGGIASALRTPEEWAAEPHALHIAGRPPLRVQPCGAADAPPLQIGSGDRPLAGLRVLDLTRVIAGPVCTRTLAAHGADVLRIGAPDLPIVDSVIPDTTLGKRFAHLDLRTADGRHRLLALASDAHVVVGGFRPGALANLGLGVDDLLEVNPALVIAELSAFGVDGPWGGRRGFDSITQTATGVVAAEMRAFAAESPRPLPCQALDHGSGFLLSLGVCSALARRARGHGGQHVSASLLTTRTWLESLGPGALHADVDMSPALAAPHLEPRESDFGPIRHAKHPGEIAGVSSTWLQGPARPGSSEPVWQ